MLHNYLDNCTDCVYKTITTITIVMIIMIIYMLIIVIINLIMNEEEQSRKMLTEKCKKLSNLSKNAEIKKLVIARFRKHLAHFEFKVDFTSFCESRC